MRLNSLALLILLTPTLAFSATQKIRFRSGHEEAKILDQAGNLEIPVDVDACLDNFKATNWERDGSCCFASDHREQFAKALARGGKFLNGFEPVSDRHPQFVVSPNTKNVLLKQFDVYYVKARVWDEKICLEFVSPNYGYGAVAWSKKPSQEVLAGSKISFDFNYAVLSSPDTEL